jgi:hypothetical protein
MKSILCSVFSLMAIAMLSQSLPQHINYQAILRNQNGEELAVNSNAVISFSIYNTLADAQSGPVYVETHNITVPPAKVVSLKIGQGTVAGSGSFSSINWASGEVNYLVGINGVAVGNRQVFSSVPYALYSVSSGSSSGTYSFSTNFNNNSGAIDLANTSVTAGTYGSNSTLTSRWPSVTVDSKGRITSASDFAANIKGDIGGKLDSQYVSSLKNVPLSNISPANGQIMQYNGSSWGPANLPAAAQTTTIQAGSGISVSGTAPNYTISSVSSGSIGAANGLTLVGTNPNFSVAAVTNASVGVWSTMGNSGTNTNNYIGTIDNANLPFRTGGTLRMLINGLSGNVGINAPSPGYKLEVHSNNGFPAIHGSNTVSANNSNGHGIWGRTISTSSLAAGIWGDNAGPGSGVIGTTSATARAAIYGENFAVTSNSLAYGVQGVSNNSNPLSAGVYGRHNAQGIGVLGTNASNTTAILGVNTSSVNNPFGIGVVGTTSSSHTAAIAVFGENKGAGIGIFGRNTNSSAASALGVYGLVSNTVSPGTAGVRGDSEGFGMGVQGVNFGNGIAVEGWQVGTGTGTTSHAGRFRITGTGNNASALLATTNGTGAAVHGINTGTTRMAGLFEGKVKMDSLQIVGPGNPINGAVLVSRDLNGNAKWSEPVMFKARFAPFSIITVNTSNIILGGTTGFSSGTDFNVGSGLSISATQMSFTAPQTGYYNLIASVLVTISQTTLGNANVYLELFNSSNNSVLGKDLMGNPDDVRQNIKVLQVNTIAFLTQGQVVIMRVNGSITNAGGITNNFSPTNSNQFSGYLIR